MNFVNGIRSKDYNFQLSQSESIINMNEEDYDEQDFPGTHSHLSSSEWLQAAVNQSVQEETTPEPELCSCRGYGWILSDYDSWHECRFHKGMPHPDFDF